MSTSPVMVITNFFGAHVNAANVGVGLLNSDGTYNVSGTVIGLGQTAQSAVDFALTGSGKLTTALPYFGGFLGLGAIVDSGRNIYQTWSAGQSPAQSDIAGVLGGIAGIAGGAALILGGGVIVPISVVAGVGAGVWQIAASAKGWQLDDLGFPIQQPLSDAQKQEVAQALGQPGATDAMCNALGGQLERPNSDALWKTPEAFDPQSGLGKSIEKTLGDALDAARDAGQAAQDALKKIGDAFKKWAANNLPNGDPFGGGDPFTGLPWAGHSPNDLIDALDKLFKQAEITTSPLVLDLDGDGVETTALTQGAYGGVHFNLDAKGLAEQTGWVGQDDGLLVRDMDGDGKITSGRELFGNHTLLSQGTNAGKEAANGFEALKDLDGNGDNVLDSNDAAFSTLRVWKDINSNGVTDAGELLTLAQAGVSSLNVGYSDAGADATADAQGNKHQQLGGFTKTDGSTQERVAQYVTGNAANTSWRLAA